MMDRAKNIFQKIRVSVKWREGMFKKALKVLKFSSPKEVAPSFISRTRYLIGHLIYLLPINDRFIKNVKKEDFACGLRLVFSKSEEKIYERNGLLYLVPVEWRSFLFSLIVNINLLSQYQEPPVLVETGDIVIDCGAYLGVASLLFAQKAGKRGKIIAIEPEDRNYEVLEKVVKLNKGKVAPIIPLKVAVYKDDCQINLLLSEVRSGSHTLSPYEKERKDSEKLLGRMEEVTALKIDTIVEQLDLERVDFIKMDIEGAEVDALLGAEETIKRFKPKLAICTYHRPTDPIDIRKILLNYNPSYRFKELERGERVLYAWDESLSGNLRDL